MNWLQILKKSLFWKIIFSYSMQQWAISRSDCDQQQKVDFIKQPRLPKGTSGKEHACECRRHKRCRFYPWIRKIPWRRTWQSTPRQISHLCVKWEISLTWEIPWSEEPGGPWSIGSQSQTELKQLSSSSIWQPVMTNSVVGPRRSSKGLPKARLAPKKKSHGHCLVVCCPSDPLQLSES